MHTEFHFGLLAGASLTSLHFNADENYYAGLTENSFPNSFMPLIGVYIDILPAKKIKNYLVSLEIYYHMYKSETDSIRINSYTSSIGSVKFSTINLNPVIRFFLSNSEKLKPFVEGITNLSVIVSKEDHYDSYSSGQMISGTPIFKDKGLELMLGAGAAWILENYLPACVINFP